MHFPIALEAFCDTNEDCGFSPFQSVSFFFFFNFLARHHYLVFAGSFGVLLRQGRKPE